MNFLMTAYDWHQLWFFNLGQNLLLSAGNQTNWEINWPFENFHFQRKILERSPVTSDEQLRTNIQSKDDKKKKINEKQHDDEEFKLKKGKKKNTIIQQKQGRNSNSNIMRSFFKFLQSREGLKALNKINSIEKTEFKITDLMQWFEENGIHYRNYIRTATIKKLVRRQNGVKAKIFIIMLNHFFEKYSRLHFLTSVKLKEGNRKGTLTHIRELRNEIMQEYQLAFCIGSN